MAPNLNGPPTIILTQEAHLNGPQFNWAPNNNNDPGSPGPLNLIFQTNLKIPPTIYLNDPNSNGPQQL